MNKKHVDKDSYKFIEALTENNLEKIKQIDKSDLHNHFVLGGSRKHLQEKTGCVISPLSHPLRSMNEMHEWSDKNIGQRFDSSEMRKLLIESTFVQAKEDGIKLLEIGEDVWGLQEYFNNDIELLISAFIQANKAIAPNIELRLQIGLSRHCPIDYLMSCLEPFWGRREFYSIDLYGDEFAQPIENFIPIYRKAKENSLKLKAHIGEWGTASDVIKGIELLGLDEIQHGIAAASSEKAMQFIRERGITLNITPTSNVLLGRVSSMKEHPLGKLYRAGINVTINSDDILMFNSSVSNEYLELYRSGVLTAQELNDIRVKSFR